jgi:hypothetical protein
LSESVEKSVVIDVSASGLDDAISGMENLGAGMRVMGTDFTRAGTSLNFLNRTFFTTTKTITEIDAAGKAHTKTIKEQNAALTDLAIAFQTVGAAMRLMRVGEEIIAILEGIAEAGWLAAAAEQARAVASFIANAVGSMGLAVPLMLAGAAAAGALTAYFLTRAAQFGMSMPEGGWVYTHPGETILSKSESMGPLAAGVVGPIGFSPAPGSAHEMLLTLIPKGGAGHAVSISVDARGSTFASDYDVDKMMNRITDRLKRAGVVER